MLCLHHDVVLPLFLLTRGEFVRRPHGLALLLRFLLRRFLQPQHSFIAHILGWSHVIVHFKRRRLGLSAETDAAFFLVCWSTISSENFLWRSFAICISGSLKRKHIELFAETHTSSPTEGGLDNRSICCIGNYTIVTFVNFYEHLCVTLGSVSVYDNLTPSLTVSGNRVMRKTFREAYDIVNGWHARRESTLGASLSANCGRIIKESSTNT
mmetsp:Transcript_77051/g.121665  ORF Transcript_77051/g.121665 Transcript_77051/m.121665 type:complete len:211 (+) Transcript_77051:713-1345(+)